jgi:hypothetical protein
VAALQKSVRIRDQETLLSGNVSGHLVRRW